MNLIKDRVFTRYLQPHRKNDSTNHEYWSTPKSPCLYYLSLRFINNLSLWTFPFTSFPSLPVPLTRNERIDPRDLLSNRKSPQGVTSLYRPRNVVSGRVRNLSSTGTFLELSFRLCLGLPGLSTSDDHWDENRPSVVQERVSLWTRTQREVEPMSPITDHTTGPSQESFTTLSYLFPFTSVVLTDSAVGVRNSFFLFGWTSLTKMILSNRVFEGVETVRDKR